MSDNFYGYLSAFTYTAEYSEPVPDAALVIRSRTSLPPAAPDEVLYVLRTGQDGKTPTVEILTPPPENSLSPDGGIPYSLVDVEASHPGYYTTALVGIQIFPGTESVQAVPMYPLSQSDAESPYPSGKVIVRDESSGTR